MLFSRREFIKTGAAGFGALATQGLARTLGEAAPAPADFSRIGFGSCLFNSGAAAALDVVRAAAPHAFVWLGDTIYGDTDDMTLLRSRYKVLSDNPRFQKLKAACPQFAIWDDHDYGRNNAGAEYPFRQASQGIFLDFWGAAANDPRRAREGIYHSQVFGSGSRTVQLIGLDGRYHRTANKQDPNGTMLGEAQWAWLADQFRIPAALRIVCSGIQVVPDEHGFEGWCEFPKERRRLYDLVRTTRTPGVVFVSGDQHWGELSKADGVLGYPAYDLTASSFDQTWPLPVNGKRVGPGTPDPNFGLIEVEWDKPDPVVRFRLLSAVTGGAVLNQAVPISALYPWSTSALRDGFGSRGNPAGSREPARGVPEGWLRFRGRTLTGRRLPDRGEGP
jgi:alkaline phosphatase D